MSLSKLWGGLHLQEKAPGRAKTSLFRSSHSLLQSFLSSARKRFEMSFFKKLTQEFDELKAKFTDDDDKPKVDQSSKPDQSQSQSTDRGASDSYYGAGQQPPPPQHQYSSGPPSQQQYPPQGYPSPQNPYSSPPPAQSPYGAPQGYNPGPPQNQYGAPPPPLSHPPGSPPCPPGWSPTWDQNSQRWYFTEHATGRTQWDPPNMGAVGGYGQAGYGGAPGFAQGDRGMGDGGYYGQSQPGGYPPQQGGYPNYSGGSQPMYGADGTKDVKKEKKSGSNAMLYGAGGLAAGAVGGALLANALGKFYSPRIR